MVSGKPKAVSGGRHVARYQQIARILAEEGLSATAVWLGMPMPSLRREKRLPDATMPERVRRALERLGPTAVKAGQALSTRPDLLPEPYRVELRRLQDAVTPVSFDEVCKVVEAEFGAPPSVIFAHFEREPLASASIGQVHAAILKTGETVAVKVQRPGIRAMVETDLDIALTQAFRLDQTAAVPHGVSFSAVAEEFAEAVRKELDYLNEADNVERFRTAFTDDEEVVIPRVYRQYTTRRVLTLERMTGTPFNRLEDIDAAGFDRKTLADRGVRAYLKQLFEIGAFHADPHPGNIFVLEDGRIAFTDFGRVGVVTPGVGDAVSDILLAVVDRDSDMATDALMSITREPGFIDVESLRREIALLIGKYYGKQIGEIGLGELVEDLLSIVRDHHLALASDFVLILATMGVLEGVGREIDPTFDFVSVAEPFARDLARRQNAPEETVRRTVATLRKLSRTLGELPSSVDRALRRVSEGEFRIAVRPEGYEHFVVRIEELVDRLAFALLVASFVVGFALLLSNERLPLWAEIIAMVGMIGAVAVAVWMFVSIYLARWRGRD